MRFVKGHGTGNDFVLLPDPSGRYELDAELVRALCDRRSGVGADGVIRVVRTAAVGEVAHLAGAAEWFMDYRNADGSTGEMCGNGVRVFVRYLLDAGLATGDTAVATRNGVKQVTVAPDGTLTADIGRPAIRGPSTARVGGAAYPGVELSTGNPHLACLVDVPLADLDLTRAPEVDRERFPTGANVEFVRVRGERVLAMRVHERGVGETCSCGTGACAAAVAAGHAVGVADGEWAVDVPGGRVYVTLDGASAYLRGPAVLVADGELRLDWLAAIDVPNAGQRARL